LRVWTGAEKVVMAGGSYGGFIAMEYAIRYPERVQALILRDTAADNSYLEVAMENAYNSSRVSVDRAKFERIMNGMLKDDEDFADCWREILPLYLHEYDPELIERRVRNAKYRYRTHNHVFSVVHKQYDIRDQLHKIRCPTLVLVGRSDWITPVEYSEFIAEQIPGAKLVVFEKSGHSPQIEEPEKFQRVVREFLVANV